MCPKIKAPLPGPGNGRSTLGSFSATRRSCGADRSMGSFFSYVPMIFLQFSGVQSNSPGRYDFSAYF